MEVDLEVTDDGVELRATVRTADRTGVEMEALTAVTVGALALIDMVKAVDKHARITDVRVDRQVRWPVRGLGRMTAAVVVITCSTRAAGGVYPDRSGPVIVEALRSWTWRSSSTVPSSYRTDQRSRPRCAPRWTPVPRSS